MSHTGTVRCVSSYCVSCGEADDLCLCTLLPSPQISSIDLICRSPKGCSSLKVFKWSGVGSEESPLLRASSSGGGRGLVQSLQLKPRPAKLGLSCEYSRAVLTGEVLPIAVAMENEEEAELSEVQLAFAVVYGQRQEEERTGGGGVIT